VTADRIVQGPRGRPARMSTHPGRRGPASRRSEGLSPSVLSSCRRRVGSRLGPRPVLQDLPDRRRIEDERYDPHRPAAVTAQRIHFEHLRDQLRPLTPARALRWCRDLRRAGAGRSPLPGRGCLARPRAPRAVGVGAVQPREMESRRRDVLAQPRQHLQRVERDALRPRRGHPRRADQLRGHDCFRALYRAPPGEVG